MLQRDYRTKANSPSGTIADSDVMTYDAASRLLTGHSGWKRFQGSVGDQSRSRRSKPWFAPISKQEIDAIAIVENASTQLHDAKGNTTYAALDAMSLGHTFGWDFDNQLVGVDVTGDQVPDVSYEYDVLRRRVARTPALGTGQVYVYAGEQIVADYERGAVAASTPTYRYVWGSYIDEPILRQASDGETLYFHRNQQYSTTALTNASGLVVERYAYTAYGQLKVMTHTGGSKSWSDNSNRYLYTGREWDAGTQLYHFRARQYSPHLGRFVSRDTLGYVDGMSLYRAYFVPGTVDPLGLNIYIIEGTGHDKHDEAKSWKFHKRAQELSYYWGGPGSWGDSAWYNPNYLVNGATGASNHGTIRAVKERICEDYCEDNSIKINLLGWSRGAVGVLEVAQQLNDDGCCCEWERCGFLNLGWKCVDLHKPVSVNWLGMFDPVNMHTGTTNDPRVPNVKKVSIARRTAYDSWMFPKYPKPTGADDIDERDITNTDGSESTHGDVGGNNTNNDALDWMIEQAQGAGVKVK